MARPATWAQFLVGVPCLSVLIGAVYLRTRSLLLTMVMHWSFNSAHDLIAGPVLHAPQGPLSSLFTLCSTGVLLLFAIMMTPSLRAMQHQTPTVAV
jgi:membrane protease YdiL (CAAX protease family)